MNLSVDAVLQVLATVTFPVGPSPWWLRGLVGGVSLLVLFRGAWFGAHGVRMAVMLAGFTAASAGMEIAAVPRLDAPHAYAGVVLLGGAASLLVLRLLWFRAGLALAGLVAGLAYGVAFRDAFAIEPGAGPVALVGLIAAVVVPWFFETFPRICTAAMGAVGLCWAVGMIDLVTVLTGTFGVGAIVQWFTGPSTVDLKDATTREEIGAR